MNYTLLRLLLILCLFTPAKAAKYTVQLSGTSFEDSFMQQGEFTVLPEVPTVADPGIQNFVQHFTTFCLNQIPQQFSNGFCSAVNANGVAYRDFIMQDPAVTKHLSILAKLILEDVDMIEIKSPEDSTPVACFFKKNSEEKFNLYMLWNHAAPYPVEFIVRVKIEEYALVE